MTVGRGTIGGARARRWWPVGALTLFMGIASAGMVACSDPGPAESSTIKVLTYNVQGAIRDWSSFNHESGTSDDDDFRFVDVLARRIVAERPDVVALQEVCESQLVRLTEALGVADYPMDEAARALSPHVDCPLMERDPPRKDGLGVAILTVGSGTPVAVPPGLKLLCADWVLGRLGMQGSSVRVCTAHVDPLPARDIPNISAVVNPWTDQFPVIVTGDFNAQPSQDSMSTMYAPDVPGDGVSPGSGRFWEADMCKRGVSGRCSPFRSVANDPAHATACNVCIDGATGGVYLKKIDYIFADAAHFSPDMQAEVESTEGQCGHTRCSDHAMYWGEIQLLKPPSETPRPHPPPRSNEEVACGHVRDPFHSDDIDWVLVPRRRVDCTEALEVFRRYLQVATTLELRSRNLHITGWICLDYGQGITCHRGGSPEHPENQVVMQADPGGCGSELEPYNTPGCPGA